MRTGVASAACVRTGGSGESRGMKPLFLRICSCARARGVRPVAPAKYHGACSGVGCHSAAVSHRLRRGEDGTRFERVDAAGLAATVTGLVAVALGAVDLGAVGISEEVAGPPSSTGGVAVPGGGVNVSSAAGSAPVG